MGGAAESSVQPRGFGGLLPFEAAALKISDGAPNATTHPPSITDEESFVQLRVPRDFELPSFWKQIRPSETAHLLAAVPNMDEPAGDLDEALGGGGDAAARQRIADRDVDAAIREFLPSHSPKTPSRAGLVLLSVETSVADVPMNMLVRSHCADRVSIDDRDAFLGEVREAVRSGRANAALFVSTSADAHLPFMQHTSLQTIEVAGANRTVPVLWVHPRSKRTLQCAATMLARIFEYEARETMRRACDEIADAAYELGIVKQTLPKLVDFIELTAAENAKRAEALAAAVQSSSLAQSELDAVSTSVQKLRRHLSFLGDPMRDACDIYAGVCRKKQKASVNISEIATGHRNLFARVGGIARVKSRVDELGLLVPP